MLVKKRITIAGSFAKPKEDINDGDIITILDEGQIVEGDYGPRNVFSIQTQNGEKNLSFNQTSMNNLIDSYTNNTKTWIGKEVKVWIIKAMVSGKFRNVVYLAAPDWTMLEDGSFLSPKEKDRVNEPPEGIGSENIGEENPF